MKAKEPRSTQLARQAYEYEEFRPRWAEGQIASLIDEEISRRHESNLAQPLAGSTQAKYQEESGLFLRAGPTIFGWPRSLGWDVITIASALNPDGCDIIASLPTDRGRSALPITAAGTWSRLPKAERLTPERPMPRWPSPVTRNCLLVGLTILGRPRSSRGARPYPLQPLGPGAGCRRPNG